MAKAKSTKTKSKRSTKVVEETPLLDPEDLKDGVVITDMETGETGPFGDPENPVPGKPFSAPAVSSDPPVVLGKKFKGEKFPTIKTSEMVAEEQKLQEQYKHPNAVTLKAYFIHKSIRNPIKQAGMEAYTKVKRATVQAFDEIFAKF